MFKSILSSLIFIALTGCVTTQQHSNNVEEQFVQVNSNLSSVERRLITTIEQHCSMTPEQVKAQMGEVLGEQIKAGIATKDVNVSSGIQQPMLDCAPASNREDEMTSFFENMIVMGEVEKIYLLKEKTTFDARIDTGAVSSSLGVYNLTKFERDGDNWIRFSLENQEDSPKYEYPIIRMIKIVQQVGSKPDNRPVIELQFKIGEESYISKFNLADRSHLEFQVLIGREFLRDIAIVDVSQKYIIGGK